MAVEAQWREKGCFSADIVVAPRAEAMIRVYVDIYSRGKEFRGKKVVCQWRI
jgi:hypothetical protein